MKVSYGLCSDAGKLRANNEDNFYVEGQIREHVETLSVFLRGTAKPGPFLAAVCDGMGGEERGEEASLLAVRSLCPSRLEQVRETAVASVRLANERICGEIRSQEGKRMGSTLSALYVDEEQAMVCHVGDSRIYLYRRGELLQLTLDQTRAAGLVRMGVLTEAQARQHPGRHELTQYLGIFEEEMILEPQMEGPLSLEDGDCFLLCSDGLTDMVSDETIAACLKGFGSAAQKAKKLVRLALKEGGRDNVTVLVIRIQK